MYSSSPPSPKRTERSNLARVEGLRKQSASPRRWLCCQRRNSASGSRRLISPETSRRVGVRGRVCAQLQQPARCRRRRPLVSSGLVCGQSPVARRSGDWHACSRTRLRWIMADMCSAAPVSAVRSRISIPARPWLIGPRPGLNCDTDRELRSESTLTPRPAQAWENLPSCPSRLGGRSQASQMRAMSQSAGRTKPANCWSPAHR